MPTYRTLRMLGEGSKNGTVGIGSQLPFAPASRSAMHQASILSDNAIRGGRRVVLDVGLNGGDSFMIPDTDHNAGSGTRHYPDATTARTIAVSDEHQLTPGHMLKFHVLAVPSGPTQFLNSSVYEKDGAGGEVQVSVLYDNGTATETVTKTVGIPASGNTYHAQSTGPKEAWLEIFEPKAKWIIPLSMMVKPSNIRKWSKKGMKATVTVKHIGSPRMVQCLVYEEPLAVGHEIADASLPPYNGYTQSGNPLGSYPLQFPQQRASASDAAMGHWALLETAERQAEQLGPVLWSWHSYEEHVSSLLDIVSYSSGTGDDIYPAATTTLLSYTSPLDANTTQWSADAPGMAVGSGGYARLYRQANREWALRGHVACVRVKVAVHMKVSDAAVTGTVRIQTAPESYVELTHTGDTSWTWVTQTAHLTCGVNPEQPFPCVLLYKHDTVTQSVSIRDAYVEFMPR